MKSDAMNWKTTARRLLSHFSLPENLSTVYTIIVIPVLVALLLPIINLQFVTWSRRYQVYQLILIILLVTWLFGGYRALLAKLKTGSSEIGNSFEIRSIPALVVFAGLHSGGAHRTVVERFLNPADPHSQKLSRLYLIRSTESRSEALEFEKRLAKHHPDLEIARDDLLADYSNLRETHRAVAKAIDSALKDFAAQEIAVDTTSGSGICSAGAVLACMERGIKLTYIKPLPGKPLNEGELKGVDVSWLVNPDESSNSLSQTDSDPGPQEAEHMAASN